MMRLEPISLIRPTSNGIFSGFEGKKMACRTRSAVILSGSTWSSSGSFQGRRKQHIQALVGWRQPSQQVANVLDEAEVEHAVGLVQYRNLYLAQFEHALLEIIDDAARCADQQVDPILDRAPLLFIAGAAESQADLESGVTPK
jgi:hypothetical protein